MQILLKCKSKIHTVRLDKSKLWKTAICPKCKTQIDPLRFRRVVIWLDFLRKRKTGSSEIPDEIRFANLRWRIEKLARIAWPYEEALGLESELQGSELAGMPADQIIRSMLTHVSRTCPGFSVPEHVPQIKVGTLKDAGGQFSSDQGVVSMTLANELITDRQAIRAVLAHEVCHYLLNNSGLREDDTDSNEKLTDICMFVCGFGSLFLDGYKREVAQVEYRKGHRLGYLSDTEYSFVRRYIRNVKSTNPLGIPSELRSLEQKFAARVHDPNARARLKNHAKTKFPQKSEKELYEILISDSTR